MSKLRKFSRRHAKTNPGEPKRNGPLGADIVEYILPGFGAFAATRFLTRVVTTQIAKRWPRYAKHAGAIASVGSFGAAWFGAHRVKMLEQYHHPIVVGSALAAIQSLVQIYVPILGWIVADASHEISATVTPGVAGASGQPLIAPQSAPAPAGFQETSAAEWFTYNDAYDAGAQRGTMPQQAPTPASSPPPIDDDQISDLLDNSDLGFS